MYDETDIITNDECYNTLWIGSFLFVQVYKTAVLIIINHFEI